MEAGKMSSTSMKLPADLATARRRLEKWRAGGRPRRPLPPELWEMAADLVPEHGIYRVSQVLRLEYYKVKEKAEGRRGRQRRTRRGGGEQGARFVQVAPVPSVLEPAVPCTVVLEDTRGRRMTIRSTGGLEPASLIAAFCGVSTCSR